MKNISCKSFAATQKKNLFLIGLKMPNDMKMLEECEYKKINAMLYSKKK